MIFYKLFFLFFFFELSGCVLNQCNNHWLLFDALQSVNACAQKVRKKLQIHLPLVNLMNDDFGIVFELSLCAINIKVCVALESFLSFFFKHEEKKSHNMLCLMLDPRFKNLHLVFSFICHEEGGEYC